LFEHKKTNRLKGTDTKVIIFSKNESYASNCAYFCKNLFNYYFHFQQNIAVSSNKSKLSPEMRYFFSFILCFLYLVSYSQSNEIPIFSAKDLEAEKQYFLKPYSQIYIDSSSKKTIQEVLQKDIQAQFQLLTEAQLGAKASSMWLKCQFDNPNADSLKIGLFFLGMERINIYVFPTHQLDSLQNTSIPIPIKRYYKIQRFNIYFPASQAKHHLVPHSHRTAALQILFTRGFALFCFL
jgi:hypothetical protein